jgi:hypothetical protein
MAPPTRALALALTAAVVLAGCGSGDKNSAGDFQGEQKAVAQTVEDLQTAGRKGDADKICSDLLAASLVQTIRRASGECSKAVDDALQDADSYEMKVEKVAINGNRATATVKSEAGDQDRTDAIALEREGSNWKIASLGS